MAITFESLVRQTRKAPVPGKLLCLDPGETTGVAIFHGLKLHKALQVPTSSIIPGINLMHTLITKVRPAIIVCEDYRVYPNKMDTHTMSSLFTPRLIGAIETIAYLNGQIPLFKEMAADPKQFVTNDKLQQWGMWQGHKLRHAHDAIRHGCYYLLFKELLADADREKYSN